MITRVRQWPDYTATREKPGVASDGSTQSTLF